MYEEIGTYAGTIVGYIIVAYILYEGIKWLINKANPDRFKKKEDE